MLKQFTVTTDERPNNKREQWTCGRMKVIHNICRFCWTFVLEAVDGSTLYIIYIDGLH